MTAMELALKHGYDLSLVQVRALAKEIRDAENIVSTGSTTYLRVLLVGTLKELGHTPRMRASRSALSKLDGNGREAQLKALQTVHDRYYAAICEEIIDESMTDSPRLGKEERSRRALERNTRTNFARSAKSTIASYIKTGFDITGLVVSAVTKRSLYNAVKEAQGNVPPSPEKLEKQLDAAASTIEGLAKALCEQNEEAAGRRLAHILNQIAVIALRYGGLEPTSLAKEAMEHCVPFRTKDGMFWPLVEEHSRMQ